MSSDLLPDQPEYHAWLGELKTRFRQVQLKAAVAVNTALLQFYWELGADIVARQTRFAWGSGFLNQLSADLMRDFPEVKGFSARNLKYIRQWYLFWMALNWSTGCCPIECHPETDGPLHLHPEPHLARSAAGAIAEHRAD